MSQPVPFSYSAVVEMWLDCGEHGRVPLARITPKGVVAKEPTSVPPCKAKLVVNVDGQTMATPVMLSKGFTPRSTLARVISLDDSIPF